MKIKLISPFKMILMSRPLPPLGISILAAHLKKNGHEVYTKDYWYEETSVGIKNKFPILGSIETRIEILREYLSGGSPKKSDKKITCFFNEIVKDLNIDDFDVIGFSILAYTELYPALIIAKFIKDIDKNKPIVFGGAYATMCGELFFDKFEFVDYLIKGEGGLPLQELLNFLNGKASIKDIPGLMYKYKNEVKINNIIIPDINNEPSPDFSGFALEHYETRINGEKHIVIPYRLSWGCVSRCSFCSFHMFQKVVEKNIYKAIAEINDLTQKYRSKYVYLTDNIISFSSEYLEEFSEELIKTGTEIMWGGFATFDCLNKPLLKKMKEAGCAFLDFGLESGSDKIIRAMEKKHTAEMAAIVLKDSYEVGIKNLINLICGYPHETDQDIELTIQFIEDNAKYICNNQLNIFTVLYASRMFVEPEKFSIANLRPLWPSVYHFSYAFDEIGGLSWKEKKKQQKRSANLIARKWYQKVESKKFKIKFVPFKMYLFLYNFFMYRGYIYKVASFFRYIIYKEKSGSLTSFNGLARLFEK